MAIKKGGQAMRTKTRQILLKVDEAEYTQIRERMSECGIINMSRFIRVLATQGYIFHIHTESVHECSRLLGNISGNINQIAKRAITTGSIYASDIDEIKSAFSEIMTQFKDVLHELLRIYDAVDKRKK
jgi:hypothetical protein